MRGPAPTMQSCFVLVDCSNGMPSLLINSVGGGTIALCRQPECGKNVFVGSNCVPGRVLESWKGNVSYGFRIGDESFS